MNRIDSDDDVLYSDDGDDVYLESGAPMSRSASVSSVSSVSSGSPNPSPSLSPNPSSSPQPHPLPSSSSSSSHPAHLSRLGVKDNSHSHYYHQHRREFREEERRRRRREEAEERRHRKIREHFEALSFAVRDLLSDSEDEGDIILLPAPSDSSPSSPASPSTSHQLQPYYPPHHQYMAEKDRDRDRDSERHHHPHDYDSRGRKRECKSKSKSKSQIDILSAAMAKIQLLQRENTILRQEQTLKLTRTLQPDMHDIVRNSSSLMVVVHLPSISIHVISDPLLRVLGYTRSEFGHMDARTLVPPETMPMDDEVTTLYRKLINGQIPHISRRAPMLTKHQERLFLHSLTYRSQVNGDIYLLSIGELGEKELSKSLTAQARPFG